MMEVMPKYVKNSNNILIEVFDFREDLSVSDSIKDCVSKQVESGKELGESYSYCRARQDFERMTPEEYLNFRGDAVASAGTSAPIIGGPNIRPMRTIGEAVKGAPTGSGKTKSSFITKVGYFNSQLELEFKNGSRYVYFVGPDFYKAFVESQSKGKYLWEKLRGKRPGLVFDNPDKVTPGGVPYAKGKGSIVPYAKGTGGTPEAKTLKPSTPEVPSEKERGLAYKETQLAWFDKGMKYRESGLPKADFTMGGFITRSGEFDYGPEGIKTKNWDNLKEIFSETKHFPIFGTRSYGAHGEQYEKLIGYTYDWEFFEPGEIDKDGHIYAKSDLFDSIYNLSDLKDPNNLPVSIGFIDLGKGVIQNISKLRHLAVSLNKLEGDRCSTMGGLGCNISIITSGTRDTEDSHTKTIKNKNMEIKKMGEEYEDMNDDLKAEVEAILAEEDLYESGNGESHNTSNAQAVFMRRCESGSHSKEACGIAWKAKEGGGGHAVKTGTQDPSKFNSKGDMEEELVQISIQEYADLLSLASTWKQKKGFIEGLEKREAERISKEKKEISDFLIARKVPEATINKAKTLCDLTMLKEVVESQVIEQPVDDYAVQQVNNNRLMDQLGNSKITDDFAKLEEEARNEALERFFPKK